MLLLGVFQFLSKSFPFLSMCKCSRLRFRSFVAWYIHTVFFFHAIFYFVFIVILLVRVLFVLFPVAVISLSLLFFYVVFNLSFRCIDAILNSVESSSSFLDT